MDAESRTVEAYHSKLESAQLVGNMGLLPIRSSFKGPAPKSGEGEEDIIDEALLYFKPNIFFREFEVKSPNKQTAQKELATLALSQQLPIPGEPTFPLNHMYRAPANRAEEETMRAYLLQLRQELGLRLSERVFDDQTQKASKWWMCFSRKRFMDKGLVGQGVIL